jgi:hypothetical protein
MAPNTIATVILGEKNTATCQQIRDAFKKSRAEDATQYL